MYYPEDFKWKIFSNFVAFSEYPNFKEKCGNGYAGENCDLPCPVVEYDPLYSSADVSYFRVVDGICLR